MRYVVLLVLLLILPLLLLLLLLLVQLHCVSESRPLLFSVTAYYYYCCCNLLTISTAFCFILINCLILFRSLECIPGPSKAANEETSCHPAIRVEAQC